LHLYRELRQLVVIHHLSEDEDVISSDDESRPDSGKKFSREAVGVGSLVHQDRNPGLGLNVLKYVSILLKSLDLSCRDMWP
jgi:hypothetical protein